MLDPGIAQLSIFLGDAAKAKMLGDLRVWGILMECSCFERGKVKVSEGIGLLCANREGRGAIVEGLSIFRTSRSLCGAFKLVLLD